MKEIKANLFSNMEFGWMATGKFYVELTNANINIEIANDIAQKMVRSIRTHHPHREVEFRITPLECQILLPDASEDSYRIVGNFIDGCVEKSRIMEQFEDLRMQINRGEI